MLCRNLPTYIVHVEMHVYYSRHFTYLLPLVIEIFNLDWLYFIQSTFLLRAQKIVQLRQFSKMHLHWSCVHSKSLLVHAVSCGVSLAIHNFQDTFFTKIFAVLCTFQHNVSFLQDKTLYVL